MKTKFNFSNSSSLGIGIMLGSVALMLIQMESAFEWMIPFNIGFMLATGVFDGKTGKKSCKKMQGASFEEEIQL